MYGQRDGCIHPFLTTGQNGSLLKFQSVLNASRKQLQRLPYPINIFSSCEALSGKMYTGSEISRASMNLHFLKTDPDSFGILWKSLQVQTMLDCTK